MSAHDFQADIDMLADIPMVPAMLKVLSANSGLRIAAIARVTESRWVACSVFDEAGFGLRPADELAIETTFCEQIRRTGELVTFDDATTDPVYAGHPSPPMYGFRSYVSVPIREPGGEFFGTLCGLDPEPRRVGSEAILGMFELFAGMIGEQIGLRQKLRRSESTLRDERATAVLREQFMAVLGHDLRSPLASIQSCLHLLEEETALPEGAFQFTRIAHQNVGRMSRLIGDVLDLTRSRLGGGIAIDRGGDAPLAEGLRQVVEEVEIAHPGHRIDASIQIDFPPPCDVDRLCQLFANLLGNAVAHGTADEPIRVRAWDDEKEMVIRVTNAGPPIDPAIRQHLFEPFVRSAGSGSREGLGLGLFIASEIARAHGGSIDMTSDGGGTCFTFRMPQAA